MARKAILETYYTFTPSTRTIVIPKAIPKERLVLITDVTTNQVLFNFSDPNLTTTSYTIATDSTSGATTTTIVLAYNTSALASTDKLQIMIDEYDEKFTPSESYLDPINKLRVSTPQSLIDTDYEYSIQTTKWEQLAMLNNRPFAYYTTAGSGITVADIQANNGSRIYTAYTTTPPAIGSAVFIGDSLYAGGDGVYTVDSNTASTFNYTGKYYFTGIGQQSIYNSGVTVVYQGAIFSNSALTISNITATAQTSGALANTITVTTTQPHGLVIGNEIAITGVTAATSGAPNGSYTVSTIISPNTFNFIQQTGGPAIGALTGGTAYVRPQGQALHRPFDGGVRFSTNAASHNQQYIRQTRRYFRYQSGKGIQMSTGTTLKPQFNIDGITYSAANGVCYVTTKDPHNLTPPGVGISVSGVDQSGYNGIYQIQNVVNPYTFTYVPTITPSANVASGNYYVSVNSWNGSSNRIGIFDSQNGLFWEYDGQTLYAVKRNSTFQIAGTISATPGSAYITGSGTVFNKQLSVGDYVVIKGMSYRVLNINSDTALTVSPQYRGLTSISSSQMSKTIDLRIPQSQFNIDRMDGTGPSGYNIDLTKMQMLYIDYSWYGAGFVRWGVRGPDGNVIYVHRLINNNVNYLAYMRSGNLPGRYETNTFGKYTYMMGGASGVGTNLLPTDTTLYVNNTSGFAPSGSLCIKNSSNTEYVNYSGITGNTFTGLTRGQAGNNSIWFTSVAGNNVITLAGSNGTGGIQVGQYVVGANIPPQTYVTSYVPNTSITLSYAPTSQMTLASNAAFYPMANVAQTFIWSATAQTAVEQHSIQFGPEVNHWGTSAIMDGGFTNDKSFIFTKGMQIPQLVQPGANVALMSFRIAPSASSGTPGSALGVREIINRMQLIPYQLDVYANQGMLMTIYLNSTANNSTNTWINVGGSSLTQYVFHSNGSIVIPNTGEPVFGFYLNSQGSNVYSSTQQDLTQLLALGSSINGGGTASTNSGIYPDGPDVLTLVAQNISPQAGFIQARLSWNEAQA
jgi:hypothetical protein